MRGQAAGAPANLYNRCSLSVTVVVPCYNEERRLDFEAFRSHLRLEPSTSFLFVNDGSSDGTGALIERFAAEDPARLSALDLERNSGKAEAVRRGVMSVAAGAADFVAFWDADLATPLAEIRRFLSLLESDSKLEVVLGSRVKMMGRKIERRARRHYVGRVAATGISNVLGLAIYDTQCGAKMFRVNETLQRVFAEPFLTRWLFDVEIIARYKRELEREQRDVREAIYELPLDEWRDVAGSKVTAKDFFRSAVDLWRIRAAYRK